MKATITLLILAVVFTFNTKCQEMNRDASTDLLKIVVEGGTQGFVDETYIHFDENATTAYDEAIDAIKWYSIDPEATMIWTVASDDTELAINNLPLDDLHGVLNTIPMTFVCGYGGGEYTLTFSELDTFDESVEIWIEDQATGEGPIGITPGENTYTFSALPEDVPDRFKIHIHDPTAITSSQDIAKESNDIKIYASANKIIVKHFDESRINDIQIYNITGQRMPYKNNYASLNLTKIQVEGPAGYYIVQATLHNKQYTQKVYVGKY